MVTPEQIEQYIREGLPDALAKVKGDGRHFFAVVISSAFIGKQPLTRHRLILELDTIKARLQSDEIHALSIQSALTPEEWQARKKDQ